MSLWVVVCLSVLSQQVEGDPGDALRDDPSSTTSAAPTTPSAGAALDATLDEKAREAQDTRTLNDIEATLSMGQPLSPQQRATLVEISASPAPRARALAAAVLPWLEPAAAVGPLLTLSTDADSRVRGAAGQSLVALARRLDDTQKGAVVAAALALLDDEFDEVACAGAELLAALRPKGTDDAFAARAGTASDVRYACLVRFGGLPVRAVKLPPAPTPPSDPENVLDTPGATPPSVSSTTAPSFVFIATAASAGLFIGGALPASAIPARDILVYDDDFTRLSRQDVSFVSQAGAALLGGALLGGGAYLLDETLALTSSEQVAVMGGTGSGVVLGAGLAFLLDLKGGGPPLVVAGATAAGLVGATAIGAFADVSADDNVLIATALGMGALAGGLGTFAAVPVALTDVGGVGRTDFGLGAAVAVAGAAGLSALAAAPFVEVKGPRAGAIAAGGALGAGVVGGLAFVVTPKDIDTATRIAAGDGLAGQVAGMVGGAFIPDAWMGLDDAAVDDTNSERLP